MAVEQPKLFLHYHEIEAREEFDPDCGVTLENFSSLIGEYQLPEEVICQVRRTDGNCGHKHRHGWLGRVVGGKEGLIGGHCAVKYFNADKRFATERNRVRREISISQSLEFLHNVLDDACAFKSRLEIESSRLRYLRQSLKELEAKCPRYAIKILKDMAKTGNRTVAVQVQYREVDDDGKEIVEWIENPIGSIAGIEIWNYQNFGTIFTGLRDIRSALENIELKREAGERKLKKWADALNSLSFHASQIGALQQAFEAFTEPRNLSLMVFIIPNQGERIELGKVVLDYEGANESTSGAAERLVSRLEHDVRRKNGNRNIRVLR